MSVAYDIIGIGGGHAGAKAAGQRPGRRGRDSGETARGRELISMTELTAMTIPPANSSRPPPRPSIVVANNDDDNDNGIPDYEETGSVAGEDDLYEVTLVAPQEVKVGAQVTLSGPNDQVRVWQNADRSGTAYINAERSSYTWVYGSEMPPETVWVEVIAGSAEVDDIVLALANTDATATNPPVHPTTLPNNPATTQAAQTKATALEVTLELRNQDGQKITPAPENEDYENEKAAAGGSDSLGPFPFGDGRGEHPGIAVAYASEVVGTVSIPEGVAVPQFRWARLVSQRSWNIASLGGGQWIVTDRNGKHTAKPGKSDMPSNDFDDATPSDTNKIYLYDNSGDHIHANDNHQIGEFIRHEKQFRVYVEANIGGEWKRVSEPMLIRHIITLKRTANTGVVKNDWTVLENTFETGEVDYTITVDEVRALTGAAAADILITPAANKEYE